MPTPAVSLSSPPPYRRADAGAVDNSKPHPAPLDELLRARRGGDMACAPRIERHDGSGYPGLGRTRPSEPWIPASAVLSARSRPWPKGSVTSADIDRGCGGRSSGDLLTRMSFAGDGLGAGINYGDLLPSWARRSIAVGLAAWMLIAPGSFSRALHTWARDEAKHWVQVIEDAVPSPTTSPGANAGP